MTTIAYFSMEIGLDEAIPTYAGGLGMLAGDTLRSAADMGLPMIGITLLHRKGYFVQHLSPNGQQTESEMVWRPEALLDALDPRVTVEIEGRKVMVRAWCYRIQGQGGAIVPVYLLDTALPENTESDRAITDFLYGGDPHYRLLQEAVLGLGGAAMIRALGYENDGIMHHINEGHAALSCLWLLERQITDRTAADVGPADIDAVRRRTIFTTHTPVPAGHDRFPLDLARQVLGESRTALIEAVRGGDGELNMSSLALRLSRYANGVSMRHAEVSRDMFPGYAIDAITNGVHAATWTTPPFQDMFDRQIPRWRRDPLYLRFAIGIPLEQVMDAHAKAKAELLAEVERRTTVKLDPQVLTIGFARRATPYKRSDLILSDLDRLMRIARRTGRMQIVFAGKAHPRDEWGKALIRRIFEAGNELDASVRVVYLADYDMALARRLVSGCDLWLNTPARPLEASGTSGMKAAMNGVPSLSILDGWWIEGHIEGVTGWSIGESDDPSPDPNRDADSLYTKLERMIVPTFYGMPYRYAEVMRSAIALNGSFFNTQRMLTQYLQNAYRVPSPAAAVVPEVAAI